MLRDLKSVSEIYSRFFQITICVFFSDFFTHFLINPTAHSWLVSGQYLNFFFYWIKKKSGICILCVKIFHAIGYTDASCYKSCFLVDFNEVCGGYAQNVGILDNSCLMYFWKVSWGRKWDIFKIRDLKPNIFVNMVNLVGGFYGEKCFLVSTYFYVCGAKG